MSNDDMFPSVVQLETIRLAAQMAVSGRFLAAGLRGLADTAHIEVVANHTASSLARQIMVRCDVRECRSPEQDYGRTVVRVPADWWQAVRERWAPKKWLVRHPVKMRDIETKKTVIRVCPHLPIPASTQGTHVSFLTTPEMPPYA